ncbi:TlpA disulfide reductase family protein [Daejeonella oryzae]|uniref:TlpA disulfide reductase family protein n=1 Tax=Daejeonella oryzae TaxID=1122943 RepID=UPI0003FD4E19|nr:TlpA disulfide reductase family protein [Daejeonella oryzae]
MKLFKILTIHVLLLFCLPLYSQSTYFTIDGKITGSAISKIYFIESNFKGQPNAKAKELKVENGKFTVTGIFKEPIPVFLSLTEELNSGKDDAIQFILDQGNIKVEINDALKTAKISGSPANDGAQKFSAGQAKFQQEIARLNAGAQAAAQRGVPMDSLQAQYEPLFKAVQKDMMAYQKRFISENPKAYISLLVISDLARSSKNYIQADSLWNQLDAKIKSGVTARQIKEYIDKEKKTSVGALAPAFSLADTSGKKVALSSVKGKYVLLDFWASWCKPCRDENPNLVEAYTKFKDKGFTVFGVSLDRDKKGWLQAIKSDELAWTQVSDLKFWSSEAALLYGINSIPANFLLDPSGKIIARDLRGPALLEKLNELFKSDIQ